MNAIHTPALAPHSSASLPKLRDSAAVPVVADRGVLSPSPSTLAVVLRRWPVTAVIVVLAAATAWFAANRYGQYLWQVEGMVVYTPLPVGEQLRNEFTPPNPQTLLSLIKSPQSLETVVQDLQLPVSAKVLDRCLRVNKPINADAASLVLDWPDPEAGVAVVNRLMDIHAREVAELRQKKVREGIELLKGEKSLAEKRLEEVRASYAAELAGTNNERLKNEWTYATKEAGAAATDLGVVREEIAQCREKIERCRAREASLTAAGAKGGPDLEDVSAPYRKRKDEVLDALRNDEHQIAEYDVQIGSKAAEVNRLRPLYERRVIAALEYEKVAGELAVLKSKRSSAADRAEGRRRELADLPRLQVQADRAELERQQARLEAKAAALEKGVAAKRKEVDRISDQMGVEAALAKKLERAENELRGVESRLAAMQRLNGDGLREFTAAHPATASSQPTSSNKKSIAVLTFAAVFGLGMLGLVGHAKLTAPTEAASYATCGLPVIAASEADPRGPIDRAGEARQIALRLRVPVQQAGGMILFTSAETAVEIEDVVCSLARYLGLRGESVLVMDARIDAARGNNFRRLFPTDAALVARNTSEDALDFGTTADYDSAEATSEMPRSGLFHLLQTPVGIDDTAYIQETPLPGVNYLPVGSAFPNSDLLTSVAMHRLLVRLSKRYNRILLLGPALDHADGTEILAGYADGAVVAFRRDAEECPRVDRAVRAIANAGVPWVGAVVRA